MKISMKWFLVPTPLVLFLAVWMFFPGADTAFQNYYPPSYTWTAKPTCAAAITGMQIFVTDVGGYNGSTYAGSTWTCNGTRWVPPGGRVLLAQFSTSAHTGTTAETIVGGTVTIPAGLLGARGVLSVSDYVTGITNSANNKTFRLRFGSSSSCATNGIKIGEVRSTVTVKQGIFFVSNTGAENAQSFISGTSFGSPYLAGTQTVTTDTIDTSAISYACYTIELANSGETATPASIRFYADIGA